MSDPCLSHNISTDVDEIHHVILDLMKPHIWSWITRLMMFISSPRPQTFRSSLRVSFSHCICQLHVVFPWISYHVRNCHYIRWDFGVYYQIAKRHFGSIRVLIKISETYCLHSL